MARSGVGSKGSAAAVVVEAADGCVDDDGAEDVEGRLGTKGRKPDAAEDA